MRTREVKKICRIPEFSEQAAKWFSEKWNITKDAYFDSIMDCIAQENPVPQWYIVLDENHEIIAGAGVIDNDFHDHKNLSPNLCALFVEKEYRGQNIARNILDFVRKDFGDLGYKQLYLVTDHREFYEKCGWDYLTMVNDDEGIPERMYVAPTL